MDENTALSLMVPPSKIRPGKMGGHGGVIQILLGRSCTKSCYNCTQGSNLGGKAPFMSLENFENAVISLKDYFGLVALFGGQPTLHPRFPEICDILSKHIPIEKRGLWTNALNGHGTVCRKTFLPHNCNLNVHLDQKDYDEFKRDWPESNPVGLHNDSRHSPVFVSMENIGITESERWEYISRCPINQHWSAGMAEFRGELRGYMCEIMMSQSQLHQFEEDYPDTGIVIGKDGLTDITTVENKTHRTYDLWWRLPIISFREQVKEHCHNCSVPLNGYGTLSQEKDDIGVEQVSDYHKDVYKPKRMIRKVEVVKNLEQLGVGRINRVIDYLQNARK